MIRKGFVAFIAFVVICGLSACSQKDKQEEAVVTEEAVEPAVKPGEMVFIPAGEFIMGTNEKKDTASAYPEHKVDLPAYWIDKYEVTNSEFLDFSIQNNYAGEGAKEGKDWRLFITADTARYPVVYITWKDAKAYCESLGKRLPTEEEWEKAARGPNGNRFPWGNEWIDDRSNTYEAGFLKPLNVGQFEDVSYYGVYDTLGNVQEWTATEYAKYKGNPEKDPNEGKGYRVVRGLSARYKSKGGGLWIRSAYVPEALYDFGCRCAKDATPEDIAKYGQAQ